MVENVKAVNNPLTIIAIFAALAEVASTVALGLVEADIQRTFVWFVMLFPSGIVLLFFGTLNWNRDALYAPGDFRDDRTYIELRAGSRKLVERIEAINIDVESLNQRISSSDPEGNPTDAKVVKLIRDQGGLQQQFEELRELVAKARSDADKVAVAFEDEFVLTTLEKRILRYLSKKDDPVSDHRISTEMGIRPDLLLSKLQRLVLHGLVRVQIDNDHQIYRITDAGRAMA